MGASNFARGNASRLFSFATDTGEQEEFEMNFYDTRDNIAADLEALCAEKKLYYDSRSDSDHSRNYTGLYLCNISKTHPKYQMLGISVTIQCLSRSAYYDGATMDWEVGDVNIGQSTSDGIPTLEDLISDIEMEYAEEHKGLAKIHAPHILKWINRTVDELTTMIEEVYGKYTDPLICVATFSNGESIYKPVEATI